MDNNKPQHVDLIDESSMSDLQKAIARANKVGKETPEDTSFDANKPVLGINEMRMKSILAKENAARAAEGLEQVKPVEYKGDEDNNTPVRVIQPNMNPSAGVPIMEDEDDYYDEDAGQGLVITKDTFKEKVEDNVPKANSTNLEEKLMDNVKEYMNDMDEIIEGHREAERVLQEEVLDDEDMEEVKKESLTDADLNSMSSEEYRKKLDEAIVIIDKTGVGDVEFTPEERAKLEHVKKIRLEEVVSKDIKTVNIRKRNKKVKIGNILQAVIAPHTSTVPLLASGYTAKFKGCSVFELMTLINPDQDKNKAESFRAKWSLVYSKMVENSIGIKSFQEFLAKTCYSDFKMMTFAIACASFPDESEMDLDCQNASCKRTFSHKYTIKSLMRVEKMNDETRTRFLETVDNSYTLNNSIAYAEASPVNEVKRLHLPETGIMIDFEYKNAENFMDTIIKEMDQLEIPDEWKPLSIIAVFIKQALIPIPDEPVGNYYSITDMLELCELLYSLPNIDRRIVYSQTNKMGESTLVDFGLTNIVCPYCGTTTNTLPVDIETILLQQCQTELTTQVE